MAKPSPEFAARPRLVVLELWGLGDLALAVPFLRNTSERFRVIVVAKAQAAPVLARLVPAVEHLPLDVPWNVFTGKYRLHQWPWGTLRRTLHQLRAQRFETGVTARRDPRDHVLLALSGCPRRIGFPRLGSSMFLTEALPPPARPHRADHWASLASALGCPISSATPLPRDGRRIVIHPGAGHPVRIWPRARYEQIATRLRASGWEVGFVEESPPSLTTLLDLLAEADRFIGNDSGPGHLAAALGVPTFTVFGPQLPDLFSPRHPRSEWIEGAPCSYKPCFDACRYPAPHCILDLSVEDVWLRIEAWLRR